MTPNQFGRYMASPAGLRHMAANYGVPNAPNPIDAPHFVRPTLVVD